MKRGNRNDACFSLLISILCHSEVLQYFNMRRCFPQAADHSYRLVAGIAGSNPARGMDVCCVYMLCCPL
jgi:hypothetical protein